VKKVFVVICPKYRLDMAYFSTLKGAQSFVKASFPEGIIDWREMDLGLNKVVKKILEFEGGK
jgi:hypothetical protein